MKVVGRKIGFWEAFSIGVGGMIGGGIFAVLGLSIQLSKSSAFISFLVAGFIALLTAYSYSKLTVRFPSEGGTIEFLVRAYGTGIFSGTLNILLLASYIVMISLYAYAFGSYAANIIPLSKHILITFSIVFFTIINALGAFVSGKTEDLLVLFKLGVLITVVVAGMFFVNAKQLSNWSDVVSIISGGMIIFLAYEGFELIANTGKDIENLSAIPKAFYASVIVVIAVYVTIAIVTVGTLPYDKIIAARDYALAIAAQPSLGKAGFWLVSLAAIASTSSAINATLYGAARASYMVAKYGELPKEIEKPLWKNAYEALLIICVISVLFANTANLEEISVAGSGGFLLIFFFVNISAIVLRDKLKINPTIPLIGAILTISSLAILAYKMIDQISILFILIFASFLTEFTYRYITGRELKRCLDKNLEEKENYLKNWRGWIDPVIDEVLKVFRDAEIYLVGSIARKEHEKSTDIDLLILTEKSLTKDERKRIVADIKDKAGLTIHPLDVHFANKKEKETVLKKAKNYVELVK